MSEVGVKPAKKRAGKPGMKTVVVSLPQAEYDRLTVLAEKQMREPNNMLSFMLAGRIRSMISDHESE